MSTFRLVTYAGPNPNPIPKSGKKINIEANNNNKKKQNQLGFSGERKQETQWGCVKGCGACCKLVKGPSFAKPEEIFEDPSDIQLYNSLIGPDDWCIHYHKPTRTCSIYADRPYFCRVQPDVFQTLYGIPPKKFHKEASSSCRDTIKAIYGPSSEELHKFNHNLNTLNH